eukprot:scaffold3114_cov114-Isochrysis_galbana.AAC.5
MLDVSVNVSVNVSADDPSCSSANAGPTWAACAAVGSAPLAAPLSVGTVALPALPPPTVPESCFPPRRVSSKAAPPMALSFHPAPAEDGLDASPNVPNGGTRLPISRTASRALSSERSERRVSRRSAPAGSDRLARRGSAVTGARLPTAEARSRGGTEAPGRPRVVDGGDDGGAAVTRPPPLKGVSDSVSSWVGRGRARSPPPARDAGVRNGCAAGLTGARGPLRPPNIISAAALSSADSDDDAGADRLPRSSAAARARA